VGWRGEGVGRWETIEARPVAENNRSKAKGLLRKITSMRGITEGAQRSACMDYPPTSYTICDEGD